MTMLLLFRVKPVAGVSCKQVHDCAVGVEASLVSVP
jgi:hypothetical protein